MTRKTTKKASSSTRKKTTKKASSSTRKKATKKTSTRTKRASIRVDLDESLVDRIVLDLVSKARTDAQIRRELAGVQKDRDIVSAHLVEARARLARASAVDRDAEIGIAIAQLSEIIYQASSEGKIAEQLAARKELSKLQGLYPSGVAAGPKPTSESQLDTIEQIEAHLRPLGIAPKNYPIEGVARVAADTIRRLQVERGAG